ncbi:MAG TPA: DUF1559 domain-containing protein [Gemmataceae bacterium]|jgi:hypothetical protein|nr:DUF1559 domain-containing protein [Gemmataceae bacterium]
MNTPIAIVGLGIVAVSLSLAAPAAKNKVEPLPPPTEEQFRQAQNNLKQIAIAWHSYHDTVGNFPCNELNKDGKALLSWRVQILPYIEEGDLFSKFKLDEPWDSENNKKLIDKMPKLYAPVRAKADDGMTFYQVFTGSHGLLKPGKKVTFAAITDGTSNTLMCVEAAKPVIWTKPDDLVFDGKDVPALGGLFDGKWNGAMCDGSVRRFKKGVEAETLRRLIDPQDGNIVDVDEAVDKDDK